LIDHIDHIVLTTRDKAACVRFYTEVLGMKLASFKTPTEERFAFRFGNQKINVHEWAGSSRRAPTSRRREPLIFVLSLPFPCRMW